MNCIACAHPLDGRICPRCAAVIRGDEPDLRAYRRTEAGNMVLVAARRSNATSERLADMQSLPNRAVRFDPLLTFVPLPSPFGDSPWTHG